MLFFGLRCQAQEGAGWGWAATSQTLASRGLPTPLPTHQLTNLPQIDAEPTCPELSQALLTPRPLAIPSQCRLQLPEAVGQGFT